MPLMLHALTAAEKVAKYRHAQRSAVCLAGDINAEVVTEGASPDELIAKLNRDGEAGARYRPGSGAGAAADLRRGKRVGEVPWCGVYLLAEEPQPSSVARRLAKGAHAGHYVAFDVDPQIELQH
jgi:hypothetical protein